MANEFDLSGILKAALDLQHSCEIRNWNFCFIGGLAVQPWGDSRATQDADLSLLTGFGNEESFVDQLLSEYKPRRANGREFALEYRVLLLWSQGRRLKIAQIFEDLSPLVDLKEDPTIIPRLEAMMKKRGVL